MNILKREFRAGLKPFLFWTLGLFVLVFAGLTKYTGIASSGVGGISELMEKFPRAALAVMGMAGADVNTLGGFYSVLAYYALICVCIYGVNLGTNAVSRESFDRTYEFVFTKPCSRSYILAMKLIAVWIYIALFSILNYVFSVAAIGAFELGENIPIPILLFSVEIFLLGSLFLALAAFLSAAMQKADKGALAGNLCFLFAFLMGIAYDMLEDGRVVKVLSPFKYFNPIDMLASKFDLLYAILCVALTAILLWSAFALFKKKDLAVL